MRIIKRGRRHIVISPSGLPVDEAENVQTRTADASAVRPVVRFDQLPVELQRALQSRPADESRAK